MAATYSDFDASTVHGGSAARGADFWLRGDELIRRAHAAAKQATDGGADTTALVGGDFGAVDNTHAARMWSALDTYVSIIDADVAGGLYSLALGSLDKGVSG